MRTAPCGMLDLQNWHWAGQCSQCALAAARTQLRPDLAYSTRASKARNFACSLAIAPHPAHPTPATAWPCACAGTPMPLAPSGLGSTHDCRGGRAPSRGRTELDLFPRAAWRHSWRFSSLPTFHVSTIPARRMRSAVAHRHPPPSTRGESGPRQASMARPASWRPLMPVTPSGRRGRRAVPSNALRAWWPLMNT